VGKFIAMRACINNNRKISNKWPNTASQILEKYEQVKPKTGKRREIIKIMAETNKIDTKKYKESTKQKAGSLKK
jgi:hypothetical protein